MALGMEECTTSESVWQKLCCEASSSDSKSLRLDRAGHQAVVWGKFIYVLAGRRGRTFYQDLLRYDTSSNTWAKVLTKLPFEPRANFGAVLVEHEVWVIGGSNNTDVLCDVHVLDLNTLQWRQPAIRDENHLLCRSGFGCDLHPTDKRAIVLFGGYGGSSDEEYHYLNDIVLLHTDRLEVERVVTSGPQPSPRAYCTLTTLGSMCYVYGGRHAKGLVQDKSLLAVFSPSSGSWACPSCSGATPAPRSSHRAVVQGSRIIMFGGASQKGGGRMNDLQSLCCGMGAPARLHWSDCDQPTAGHQPPGRSCHTLSLVAGCLYLICGYTGCGADQQYAPDVWKLRLAPDSPQVSQAMERRSPKAPLKRSAQGAVSDSAPCEDGGWHHTKRQRTAAAQQHAKQSGAANKRQQLVQQAAQAAAAAAAAGVAAGNGAGLQAAPAAVIGRFGRGAAVAAVLDSDKAGTMAAQAALVQRHGCRCPNCPLCCAAAGVYEGPSPAELKRVEEELRSVRWMLEEQQKRTQAAEEAAARLREELTEVTQQCYVERRDCQRHKLEAEAQLSKLQSEQASRAQAEQRLEAANTEVAELRANIEALAGELAASKAETKAARAEAAAHAKEAGDARGALRAARADSEKEGRQAAEARQKLLGELAEMRARREQLEDSLNGVTRALQTAQADLARERASGAEAARAAASEREEAARQQRELQQALDAARVAAAAHQREAASLQAALQQRNADAESLQARVKAVEDARAKAEAELATERQERAELRQRHAALKDCWSGLGPEFAQLAALARAMGAKFEAGNQKLSY